MRVKLGDICEIVGGSTPKSNVPEYWDGNVKWITPAELNEDSYVLYDSVRKITELGAQKTGLNSFPAGTVILSSRAPIGKVAIAGCEMYCNQGFKNLICSDAINNKYLYWFLKGKTAYLNSLGRGATFKEISKQIVANIEIDLPPIERQSEIAAQFEIIASVLRHHHELLSTLDDLIKARFVEMFGAINETVPLSYYIESLTAGKSLAGEVECLNKVLKTGAATYDYFDPTQVKNLPKDYEPVAEHQLHDGDIIISRMNTAELVGAAAYVWIAPAHTYLPDRLWRAELRECVNPIFVWQAIVQPTTKEAIRKIAGGTSGSMKNISKPGLLSIHVKKVSVEMQNDFAAFVSQVNKSKFIWASPIRLTPIPHIIIQAKKQISLPDFKSFNHKQSQGGDPRDQL